MDLLRFGEFASPLPIAILGRNSSDFDASSCIRFHRRSTSERTTRRSGLELIGANLTRNAKR